ncbi:MAG: tol-pal system protein YbgF [Nitrosospira sp.]|nr:tol-pal system protein YbgF [Nitrosospira sp.]MDN5881612.1 tol-pal system protein YbgF [Nitrosospira sp.]MDN5934961.1 tol-pal system protein YbgF [Nitrosospira sp.]
MFDDQEARKQIAAQQASIGDLRSQGQALETRIVKLEELLNNQPMLDLHNQMEALRLDLNKLQGQIEVLVNENELTQKRQKDFYIDLDNRLRRLEQPGEPAASESPASATMADAVPKSNGEVTARPESNVEAPTRVVAVIPSAAGVAPADTAESQDYEAAYNLFKTAKYYDAISRLKKFLKSYPASSLAPSAHYWIGNSYYALRDFKNAIDAQEKLISAFPDSAKAPDAMLNIASSQQEMHKKPAAKKTLESLLVKYPGSEAAEKAKRRLASNK